MKKILNLVIPVCVFIGACWYWGTNLGNYPLVIGTFILLGAIAAV